MFQFEGKSQPMEERKETAHIIVYIYTLLTSTSINKCNIISAKSGAPADTYCICVAVFFLKEGNLTHTQQLYK